MNEETLQALTTLASKLGTTAEYLWGVLVRQAPITGITHLLVLVSFVFATWFLIQFVNGKTQEPEATKENRFPQAEWDNEAAFFAWFFVAVFAMFTAILFVSNASTIVAALLNPEYWALKQIIK